MQRVTRLDVLIWLPRVAFFVMAAIFLGKYVHYLNAILPFPYDWEPTDGDHLNFAHRLAQGLPIYLSLKEGQVLSIYNPLYHGVVALFGGAHASLSFARTVSFLFWLLTPLAVLWYFRKRWGFFYAATAALFIWLPAEPTMLVDIVQVSPSSTMAFLFVATLLYATRCSERSNTAWWEWLILGAIAALCYFAKQQGLIAIAVTVSFLFFQRINLRDISLVILGFLVVFLSTAAYLELLNSGQYLNATLFDLHKIIISSPELARKRLVSFLLDAHFYFIVCILLSFVLFVLREREFKKLSIWQISFVLHIPFLLAILGNNGGGASYFLSMWISMVLLCIETVRKVESRLSAPLNVVVPVLIIAAIAIWGKTGHPDYAVMTSWAAVIVFTVMVSGRDSSRLLISSVMRESNHQDMHGFVFSTVLLVSLFINGYLGMMTTLYHLGSIALPTPKLEKMMQDYYQSVALLVADKPPLKILTNRTIGAFVSSNLNIENEGCTMFCYAWKVPSVFNRGVIINAIRDKRFDLIATGQAEFPEEVNREIASHYQPVLTKEVNFHFGRVGTVNVYVPKPSLMATLPKANRQK